MSVFCHTREVRVVLAAKKQGKQQGFQLFVTAQHFLNANVCITSFTKQNSEDLDQLEMQARVTLPTGNHRTLSQGDREKEKQQENDKSTFRSDASDRWFLV